MHVTRFATPHREALEHLLLAAGLPTAGFDPAPDRTVVAYEKDRLIGTASLNLYGEAALLRSVVVAEDSRGTGVGRELSDAALRLARQSGAKTVYLLTETASRFFSHLGFNPVARESVPADVAGDVEFTTLCPSAVAMAMQLPPA